MKIYYYYFDQTRKRIEKYIHDAEEKKATYKITDTSLEHMFCKSVRKDEIGRVVLKWSDSPYVILIEDNDEKAKNLFAEYYYGLIDKKKREIDEIRELIKENFSESEG